MIKNTWVLLSLFLPGLLSAQHLQQDIKNAIVKLETDPQFKNAIISLYIADTKTGKLVYEKNSNLGLAPASCQKIITSIAAFELLGPAFRYHTVLAYEGDIQQNKLTGNIYLTGNGDPTLGSWRWPQTNEDYISNRITEVLKKSNIGSANTFIIDDRKWGTQTIPEGWVWEDIGNYYGAGCSAFNWHENQYDIILKAGKKIGDPVTLLSKIPVDGLIMNNELQTAAKGTGDNAYVFSAPHVKEAFIRGSIPLGAETFTISAAAPGMELFATKITETFSTANLVPMEIKNSNSISLNVSADKSKAQHTLYVFDSPPLDSINYWFLKKSINLYGEAFVKTIGYEKSSEGSTKAGIELIRTFWEKQGIEKPALKIIDGSGLSPANRLTTAALVKALQFASGKGWFSKFYDALPEMNGIKMKDGYISGVRSYCGYINLKNGTGYCFAFIVNNFDGNPGSAREKIWKVLDFLK